MIALEGHGWRAGLPPEFGASLTRLARRLPGGGWQPVLEPPSAPGAQDGGCFVMAPFANRIADGRFSFTGRDHRIPVNRPAEGMAIHGCARDRAWRVVEATGAGATLALHLDEPALPWRFDLVQRVTLGAAGVLVTLDLTNRGAAPMPFGIGLHPWFCKTEAARLEFAPARLHRRDARGLPLPETDPQPGFTPGAGQNLGDLHWLDGCASDWSGRARLRIGALDLILAATGALRHLQVYVPDDRPVFCAEPVSHLPDAVNRPDLGPQAAMTVLAPGDSLSGTMRISAAPFDATAPEGDRP